MSFPPGTYRACFVPQQTGYPTASQQVNRATQVLSNAAVFIQQPVNFGAVVAVTEPPGPQQAYDAWQAVLAYEAFRTQMAQQSVAEQPQYIRFVGTPEDIALLRQELERGRPVQFVQQLQGGALGPLVNEIETQSISTASRPTISDADDSSGGVRFRGPNGEFTYDEWRSSNNRHFLGYGTGMCPMTGNPSGSVHVRCSGLKSSSGFRLKRISA